MAKLVVNIKGQSEEFGLTDDARDIGGNDYLTVSNGNKKQYARLGNDATKLIIKKNNQKFYVQKDPIYFIDKNITTDRPDYDYASDIYLPKGSYITHEYDTKPFTIKKPDTYKVIVNMYSNTESNYLFYITIVSNGNYILNKQIVASKKRGLTIKRLN